jgi:ABC-2 type transport system ATP-binding protein
MLVDVPPTAMERVGRPRSVAPPAPLVSVSGLSRSYGSRRAVGDVTFELGTGITGLLGPNGAGKSSLITCLAGIAPWDSGTVRIDGVDLAAHPAQARSRLGFMPERVAFPPDMRVGAYLTLVAGLKRIPRQRRAAAVDETVERAGLVSVRDRIVANLSKGYRQRVGLAQAFLGWPPVVILDEPTAGLDPLSVLEIRDLLTEVARHRAVLVSTHQLAEARLLCDRVIVMSGGAVVYDGVPAAMGRTTDGPVRTRLRLRRRPGSPPATLLGADVRLVEGGPTAHGWTGVVEAVDDERLGILVSELARDWLVVGVEPTVDQLEAAFRDAVTGPGRVGGGGGARP